MELSHAVVLRCQPKLWRASQDEKGRNVSPQLGELIELVWLVIKLLYLLGTDKTFLFGSELKEFLSIPPFLTAINHVAWSIWVFKFVSTGLKMSLFAGMKMSIFSGKKRTRWPFGGHRVGWFSDYHCSQDSSILSRMR